MLRTLILAACFALIALSCEKDPAADSELKLLGTTILPVLEASGLSPYLNSGFLVVSDTLERVFVMDISGAVIDTLLYKGNNPEGVAWDEGLKRVYVVEENSSEVVVLDQNGLELNRFTVEYNRLYEKHGLEGITINPANNHLYLVSEKTPAILFEFSPQGQELNRSALTFAQDYSSVYFDSYLNKLWILSDDSKTLTRCSLDGKAEKTWQTGIEKAEGVVVDSYHNLVYMVSDKTNAFYKLSL